MARVAHLEIERVVEDVGETLRPAVARDVERGDEVHARLAVVLVFVVALPRKRVQVDQVALVRLIVLVQLVLLVQQPSGRLIQAALDHLERRVRLPAAKQRLRLLAQRGVLVVVVAPASTHREGLAQRAEQAHGAGRRRRARGRRRQRDARGRRAPRTLGSAEMMTKKERERNGFPKCAENA